MLRLGWKKFNCILIYASMIYKFSMEYENEFQNVYHWNNGLI